MTENKNPYSIEVALQNIQSVLDNNVTTTKREHIALDQSLAKIKEELKRLEKLDWDASQTKKAISLGAIPRELLGPGEINE